MNGEEGELIARERSRQRMTTNELMELSGVDRKRIESIEEGRDYATSDEVENIAGALGIAPHDIRRAL